MELKNNIYMETSEDIKKLRNLSNRLTEIDDYLLNRTKEWEYAFNSLKDIVIIADVDRNITYVNDSFLFNSNMDKEDIIGRDYCVFLYESTDVDCLDIKDEPFYVESLGGWFENKTSNILNDDDVVLGYICILRNITRRIRAEKKAKDRQKALDQVQDIGKIGGWFLNVTKEKLTWTDQMYKLHNISKDKYMVCIDGLGDFYKYDDFLLLKKTFLNGVRNNESWQLVLKANRIDDVEQWFKITGMKPSIDDSGDVVVSGTTQDVTNEYLFRNKLQNLLEKTMFMCNNMHNVGMWYKDSDFRYIIADGVFRDIVFGGIAFEEVSGKTSSECFGNESCVGLLEDIYDFDSLSCDELFNIDFEFNEDYNSRVCTFTDLFTKSKKEPCRFFEVIYIDGEKIALDVFKTPVFKNGNFIGIVGMCVNFTSVFDEKLSIMKNLEKMGKALNLKGTESYYIKRYI